MDMKGVVGLLLVSLVFGACQKNETISPFTGNQVTYALQQGSQYPVSGTATFKERKDGAVTVVVQLTGISAGTTSPVHLHLGDISVSQAAVAALLSPLEGKSGISETTISKLADESPVDYQRLAGLNACIKVHLSDTGAGRDIILAAGNVGSAVTKANPAGRIGIAVCKSE